MPSNKPKIILPLFDGGVTDIDYEADDNPGCPTCDYGSSYVDDFSIELTRFRIGIHINSMYNHFVSEGWLMRRLLMADHGMTEGQFVTWLRAVLNDHFRTEYGFHEVERRGTTDPPTFSVYDKTTGKTERSEFAKFDEQEYLKRLRREQYENENG